MKISNWGNFPRIEAEIKPYESDWKESWLGHNYIARGLGRSYGDASLNDRILSTLDHSGILNLDEQGILNVKGGTSLASILKFIIPKGFFLPVSPGTKYVTIGGAIAADIHGKNHHKDGTIFRYIRSIELFDGENNIRCSPSENSELFNWTCGGMGLTGIITQAEIQLKRIESTYIRQKTIKAFNLESLLKAFDQTEQWTYSVAWLDSMAKGKKFGRGILYLGEHAKREEIPETKEPLKYQDSSLLNFPFFLPSFILNPLTNNIFNKAYFNLTRERQLVGLDPFFYPLDKVGNWNRAYGRRGFLQYQIVIPEGQGLNGVKEILGVMQKNELSSFLTVLKKLGEGRGYMSFPIKGYTLALDFPATKRILNNLHLVDEVVHNMGGRVYLAKDSRLDSENLTRGYPELEDFKKYITGRPFHSRLSNRLGIT